MDDVTSETLAELEKTQKDFWNIPRKTGVLLNMFIKMMGAKNALEIGTSNGYSGLWLAKALKETGGRLTTIEYYDKRQSVAIENFKKCGVIDVVRPLQGSACEVIEAFDESEKFDFVFIIIKEKCIENILIMGYFGKVFKRVLTKYFSVVKIFIFHVLIL